MSSYCTEQAKKLCMEKRKRVSGLIRLIMGRDWCNGRFYKDGMMRNKFKLPETIYAQPVWLK